MPSVQVGPFGARSCFCGDKRVDLDLDEPARVEERGHGFMRTWDPH